MKLFSAFLPAVLLFMSLAAKAQEIPPPDTVTTGLYVTSIYDIDFRQREYTVNLWLWLKYKNRAFDFVHNIEIPAAKNFTQTYVTVDSSGGQYYVIMKLQCVMRNNTKTDNFPFDKQRLWFSIENSQYDSTALVFAVDTTGDLYDKKYSLQGWDIDSCKVSVGTKLYKTAFGSTALEKPEARYSTFRLITVIKREPLGLFLKLFLGMYIAFLIAFVCFFIHADGMDSRFGLSVGAVFAVIGNKYIIDSSLPETVTFTLVDKLHGITLFFILLVVIATAYSLQLVKQNKIYEAKRFDMRSGQVFIIGYVLINVYLIWRAYHVH